MKSTKRHLTQLVALLLLITGICAPAQGNDWKVGDVFVAIGGGQFKVYSNSGVLKETITDGIGNGATAGCACDSTYHLYTTNFSETKAFRYKIDHPHQILQTIDTNVGSPGGHSESIVFDGQGNFYVGHADANGSVLKYDATGTLVDTFPAAAENRGADWIDLTANLTANEKTTLFYTSEGRLIKRYEVSTIGGTQLSDFADLGNSGGSQVTLYALRLLPPGNGSGGLLVADKKNIKRLNGAGAVIQTYDASGENDWQALTLDTNGSFWAGDATTHNFYRFNINTGTKEVGPINTSSSSLSGMCVYGGFSAAQPSPQPMQTFTFTSASPSKPFSLLDRTNILTVTLNNVKQGVGVGLTARASLIEPAAGISDNGWPCTKTAGFDLTHTAQKCVVWQLEASPDSSPAFSSVDFKISQIPSDMDTRFLRNEAQDITTFVKLADPGGTRSSFSIYSLNQAPVAGSATSCGYQTPITEGAILSSGTLPFRFQAAANCSTGPFRKDLHPHLSLVRLVKDGAAPHQETIEVAGNSGVPPAPPIYRLQADGKTYKLEISTKHLPPGVYIATTFEDSTPAKIPAFDVQFTLE